MVFQDPLTSLNPLYTVGWQLIETILTHQDLTEAQARKHAIDLLGEVGIPIAGEAKSTSIRTSSPAACDSVSSSRSPCA